MAIVGGERPEDLDAAFRPKAGRRRARSRRVGPGATRSTARAGGSVIVARRTGSGRRGAVSRPSRARLDRPRPNRRRRSGPSLASSPSVGNARSGAMPIESVLPPFSIAASAREASLRFRRASGCRTRKIASTRSGGPAGRALAFPRCEARARQAEAAGAPSPQLGQLTSHFGTSRPHFGQRHDSSAAPRKIPTGPPTTPAPTPARVAVSASIAPLREARLREPGMLGKHRPEA